MSQALRRCRGNAVAIAGENQAGLRLSSPGGGAVQDTHDWRTPAAELLSLGGHTYAAWHSSAQDSSKITETKRALRNI